MDWLGWLDGYSIASLTSQPSQMIDLFHFPQAIELSTQTNAFRFVSVQALFRASLAIFKHLEKTILKCEGIEDLVRSFVRWLVLVGWLAKLV